MTTGIVDEAMMQNTSIGEEFAGVLRQLVELVRPLCIIETGAFCGTGTTTAFCRGLQNIPRIHCHFHSIEVNPLLYGETLRHLAANGMLGMAHVHCGLSLPRAIMPTLEDTTRLMTELAAVPGIRAEFGPTPSARAQMYHREVDHPVVPDDLLGLCLASCGNRPDIVCLDSAGHLGFLEFQYVVDRLRGPCFLVLDDVNHVKHWKSVQAVKADRRFSVLRESAEHNGFCVAKFIPEAGA